MRGKGKGGVAVGVSGRPSLQLENYTAIFFLDAPNHISDWPRFELEERPRRTAIKKLLIPEVFL